MMRWDSAFHCSLGSIRLCAGCAESVPDLLDSTTIPPMARWKVVKLKGNDRSSPVATKKSRVSLSGQTMKTDFGPPAAIAVACLL